MQPRDRKLLGRFRAMLASNFPTLVAMRGRIVLAFAATPAEAALFALYMAGADFPRIAM
tara:strand:- start:77 stop:253 length:177 start_codon:yes stop_codon:yes gene_type:complete